MGTVRGRTRLHPRAKTGMFQGKRHLDFHDSSLLVRQCASGNHEVRTFGVASSSSRRARDGL